MPNTIANRYAKSFSIFYLVLNVLGGGGGCCTLSLFWQLLFCSTRHLHPTPEIPLCARPRDLHHRVRALPLARFWRWRWRRPVPSPGGGGGARGGVQSRIRPALPAPVPPPPAFPPLLPAPVSQVAAAPVLKTPRVAPPDTPRAALSSNIFLRACRQRRPGTVHTCRPSHWVPNGAPHW